MSDAEEKAVRDEQGGSVCVRGRGLEYFAAMLRRIEAVTPTYVRGGVEAIIRARRDAIRNWARGFKRMGYYPTIKLGEQELRDEIRRQENLRRDREENRVLDLLPVLDLRKTD